MIDNSTKEQIKEQLNNYCVTAGSDNKASKSLGISNAYISNIKNNKWEPISDDFWRKLSKLLNINLAEEWIHADTRQYMAVNGMFYDAQQYANVYGIICEPGSCKTHTLDKYSKEHRNVYYVKCQRHTTDRFFLEDLIKKMGVKNPMNSSAGCLTQLRDKVERLDSPLIIIDEIEKVANDVMMLFIDIYNICDGKAGIVLLGTPNLAARVDKGIKNYKVGFNEILSRVGGRFVSIPTPSKQDALAVIKANGVSDSLEINTIINDFGEDATTFDLRRIKRLVHKVKLGRASSYAQN